MPRRSGRTSRGQVDYRALANISTRVRAALNSTTVATTESAPPARNQQEEETGNDIEDEQVAVDPASPQQCISINTVTSEARRKRIYLCRICGQPKRGHVCTRRPSNTSGRGDSNQADENNCITVYGHAPTPDPTPVSAIADTDNVILGPVVTTPPPLTLKRYHTPALGCVAPTMYGHRRRRRQQARWIQMRLVLPFLKLREKYFISCLSRETSEQISSNTPFGSDNIKFWSRPIRWKWTALTDGLQWVRLVQYLFPADSRASRHCWAVQYLSRVRGLRSTSVDGILVYHQARCSSCAKKTCTFHFLRMKYLCTSCTNNHTLTHSLISETRAQALFRVGPAKLRQLPCAVFMGAQNHGGKRTKYFLSQQVRSLSKSVWKRSAKTSTYAAAAKIGPFRKTVDPEEARMQSISNKVKSKNYKLVCPPQNSAVSKDLSQEPPRERFVRAQSMIQHRLRENYVRSVGRPVSTGTDIKRMCVRTVGLNGSLISTPVISATADTPENRRKIKRRLQQRLRRAKQKEKKSKFQK